MNFQRTFTSAPWEKTVGYCRALKAGPQIYVTGTAPVGDDGSVVALGDAYSQAKKCFQIIEKSLKELNVSISSVVRTRMFVTDISRWEEYGKAHAEFFGNHPPTTSMLEVKGLIDPDMLIEIEADAYVET
jgi:enamine deaminase RidA (YjgF/YER057c/UK114 family)